MKTRHLLCILAIIIIPVTTMPQSGGPFEITKSVITGGGGSTSGGTFTLDSTMGQPIGGATSVGGTFEVGSGFWGGGLPLATAVSVSGRVLTPDNRGLRNAVVKITPVDSLGNPVGPTRTVTTSSLGNYTFDNVATGQNYSIKVSSKLFRFASRTASVGFDNLTGIDFVGQE